MPGVAEGVVSQSLQEEPDFGLEYDLPMTFCTERVLKDDDNIDDTTRLIQELRLKYTDEQICNLLKKMENQEFIASFQGGMDYTYYLDNAGMPNLDDMTREE